MNAGHADRLYRRAPLATTRVRAVESGRARAAGRRAPRRRWRSTTCRRGHEEEARGDTRRGPGAQQRPSRGHVVGSAATWPGSAATSGDTARDLLEQVRQRVPNCLAARHTVGRGRGPHCARSEPCVESVNERHGSSNTILVHLLRTKVRVLFVFFTNH